MRNPSLSHYDVIVIGAGSVGTPAAFYLAQAGLRVLVLDSGPSVGQASNKKAIGGIRATHSDPAKIRMCRRSIEIFSTWKDLYGDDIEWSQSGYAFVAYREQEESVLKELLVVQHSFDLNLQWQDRESMLELIPDLNPDGLLGGTFSPEDGNASPLLAVHAFYDHARVLGAEFRFQEMVTGLETDSGRIVGVCTNRGRYGADLVINAAGAHAGDIGRMVGMSIPVRPDCHEAAITEAVAPFLKPMVVDIRPAPGSSNYYFYQHCTGQIVFCITPRPQIWGDKTHETSSFLPMVARRMVDIMPRLMNIRVRRTWRGLYPMTPDGFPIVGWSREVGGFLQAAGMCGQGFMLGPALGELLTRLALGQEIAGDQEILQILSPYREFVGQEKLK